MAQIIALGSLGMLSEGNLEVASETRISKEAVPPEDMQEFRDLANSAGYYSSPETGGVFCLNGHFYHAQIPEGASKVRTREITRDEFRAYAQRAINR